MDGMDGGLSIGHGRLCISVDWSFGSSMRCLPTTDSFYPPPILRCPTAHISVSPSIDIRVLLTRPFHPISHRNPFWCHLPSTTRPHTRLPPHSYCIFAAFVRHGQFFHVGIGPHDGTHSGASTLYTKSTGYAVKTLDTIVREMNVSAVDVVRLDAEGAEWVREEPHLVVCMCGTGNPSVANGSWLK